VFNIFILNWESGLIPEHIFRKSFEPDTVPCCIRWSRSILKGIANIKMIEIVMHIHADGGVVVLVVRARWVAQSWLLVVWVYVDCRDDILIRRVNQKRMCRDYDSSLPLINASAMVSPGIWSTAGNQYHVPGTEYITGTLILRSFGVLEEVSSTGTEHLRKSRVPVQLVRRNMYLVPGTEYVTGTLILRSFGVNVQTLIKSMSKFYYISLYII